jgi:hypothetical protein
VADRDMRRCYSLAVMVLTSSQREALKLLADAREGCTVPALMRGGCPVDELPHLARSRLTSQNGCAVRVR